MRKNNTITWVAFAVLFTAVGWFGHQHLGNIVSFVGSGMKSETLETASLKKADEGEFCAQVITPAINPETKEIREFPTTCSVPQGWERIENDIPELDLEVQ